MCLSQSMPDRPQVGKIGRHSIFRGRSMTRRIQRCKPDYSYHVASRITICCRACARVTPHRVPTPPTMGSSLPTSQESHCGRGLRSRKRRRTAGAPSNRSAENGKTVMHRRCRVIAHSMRRPQGAALPRRGVASTDRRAASGRSVTVRWRWREYYCPPAPESAIASAPTSRRRSPCRE